MLQLTIIGIVCAISAPSEGTAFIGPKNNESVFCHFEREQNIAKVFQPSYNVDVYNSSDCAKTKITNRTSSLFYDYVIKQYQNSENSSCSIVKNALLEKEEKLHSNVEFAFRKRNLLWIYPSSRFPTKTLKPVMEGKNFESINSSKEEYRPKKFKAKTVKNAERKLKLHDKYNLNPEQKKMFLRLKKINSRPEREIFYPKHLDRIKVVDELDLNKRIEKLVKKVALENQQKEKYYASDYALIKSPEKGEISDSSQEKEIKKSFFNIIKKLFCFHKDVPKNKKDDMDNVTNSLSVNKVRGKSPIAEKMALISSSDVSKTKKKTTRFRRNPYSSYTHFSNSAPIHRQNYIETPYPYSANFLAKKYYLYPPGIRQFFPENERTRLRLRNNLENWPFLKNLYFDKRKIHDSKLKCYDVSTEEAIELPATKEKDSTTASSFKDIQEIKKSADETCACCMESMNTEKSPTEGSEFSRTTEETISSSFTSSEDLKENKTSNPIELDVSQKDKEDNLPNHTLEKPFLKRDLRNEKYENYKSDPNFEAFESHYYNVMSDFPKLDFNYFHPNLKPKYELPDTKYLNPFPFLKIRHALRNYHVRNNVWNPSQRSFSFERKKRCGRKRCSVPRKFWRSAPLLCVPYIKKSQEDVLKYLIKVMEKMIGKPLLPKRDIFDKTKFKPFLQNEILPGCDRTPEEEIYECKYETAPPFHPEFLDMCPPAPQLLYGPNPKSFFPFYSPSSSFPSCSFSPKLCGASPYPPYFPYSDSVKISPEFAKSYSYALFNPSQIRQCLRPNSWPPNVPFYAPRVELIKKQNQVSSEKELVTISPRSTSSVPVSTMPRSNAITPETNVSNFSQIVVSIPVNTNTSTSKVAEPSSLQKSYASDFNALPSQSAPTTTTTPITLTHLEGVSSTLSTRSTSALCVSNLPVGQEEHLSYSAVPYNRVPECDTHPNQNSETMSPVSSNQQPIVYNPIDSQKLHCAACFAKVENTSPNTQQVVEWPSTVNPLPTTETYYYQPQIKETPKSYKELFETSQEYPLEYPPVSSDTAFSNQFMKDRSRNFDLGTSSREGSKKSFEYNDNLQNEHQVYNSENPQKGYFRMKHKKTFKSKSQPTEFLPPYDYYVYKYPIMRPNDNSNMKSGRYPVPQFFWKNFGRKLKTNNNPKSLIRRKRKDYDFWSDDFDSYSDYFDDPNNNDEGLNKHPRPDEKCFTENCFNSETTPPSYEMLNELAKIITEFNDTQSESTTPISVETTFGTYDSTDLLTDSSPEKLSTNLSNLRMTKSTSNKTNDKVDGKKEKSFSQDNGTSSNLPDDTSFTQVSPTTAAIDIKSNIKDRAIDSKKSGKTSFFQTNSKIIQTSKNSKKDPGKEEKELESIKDTKTKEECQIPTTLKTATIIKGQKKSSTKLSSKVYPKVYPDSFPSDVETNDTSTTTVTIVKAYTENRTALLSPTSKPDIKLQLLAVCEGYLEIVKLIKGQNQPTEGDLDADLVRYCENIISQNFNNQLEKPKKSELMEFSPQNTNKGEEMAQSYSENSGKLNSGPQTAYEAARDFSESQLREKIIADILRDPVCRKKTAAKKNKTNKVTSNNDDDDDDDDEDDDDDDSDEDDRDEDESANDNDNITKKNEGERQFTELQTTDSTEIVDVGIAAEKDNNNALTECLIKKQRKLQKKEKVEKGSSKEEIRMLEMLKKRKKALLSWLFDLKDLHKLDDLDETEYFDEEELITETETSENSGTIKPKGDEKKTGRTKKNLLFDGRSDFPIYAKRYGYDKGGELREVEVLWRKINKKTREKKIFKKMCVLALVMTSKDANHEDPKLVVNNGHENEGVSGVELKNTNKTSYAAVDLVEYNEKPTASAVAEHIKILQDFSSSTLSTNTNTKSTKGNINHTYKCKPDSSSILGECPQVKKAHPNTTRKTSRKMDVAKDIFQEYTIEFVNYAVYILPIMLTIIFLFCCLCCALHILKAQQSLKRYRKKKKQQFIPHDTSDTTEESGHRSKKKKWKVNFKKKPKNPESDTVSDKIGLKKLWSVLKLCTGSSDKKENFKKGRKTLLKFLKGNKEKEGDEESHRTDDHSEAAERRELIALLEEVKKIEMEQMGDKEETRSVQVQYMTQDDGSVFQRPEVFYPYQKNVLRIPKGYSFGNKPYTSQQTEPPMVEDCELYEDVNELTELLPCECTYFSKKSDCLRHCNFSINPQDPCKRFLKIFRDSGVCHNRPLNEKNFVKNESENRRFIFNKYRSISMDPSEELMEVTQKNTGTETKLTDTASPLALSSPKNPGILKEIDDLKRQLNSKRNVCLKDDGVLCRL